MSAANQVIKQESNNVFLIKPSNFSEFERYCNLIAKSSFCPKAFTGKPGDVMVAIQMGAELGLSPMQAIQNIAVINGRPCVWGDAALAVVMGSPHYAHHKEWVTGDIKSETLEAHCLIKRKGSEDYTYNFSISDARKAGLWGKAGVWQQYPTRMLQMRARGFALRDKFADALRGINIREEVEDYEVKSQMPKNSVIKDAEPIKSEEKLIDQPMSQQVKQSEEPPKMDIDMSVYNLIIDAINMSEDIDQLKEAFELHKEYNFQSRPDLFKGIIDRKDYKKNQLLLKISQESNETEENVNEETGEIEVAG